MKIAYFDCFNGAAGDMIVAALLDAGADAGALRSGLDSLGVGGYALSIEKITKQGFAATRFRVELDPSSDQPHRHLKQVVEIINGGKLSVAVTAKAIAIFERLAEAEAAVHGTSVEKVHFHEVGAVDAIVDVVGAVLACELLGVEEIICSPIPVGSGTVTCEHGVIPVPAPATARMLKGVPLAASDETGELTTPTGAAVLTTLASRFGAIPAMTMTAVGVGAGSREGRARPNILRVLLGTTGDAGSDADRIVQLETNLDDVSPEIIGYCQQRLLDAGALDVYTVPIHMKKWRTGVVLTVLCKPGDADTLERIVFAETTTFGVRRQTLDRHTMHRRSERVTTPFGEIRVKIGRRGDIETISPEYDDCRAAAIEHDTPLRDVVAAARAAWSVQSRDS